MYLLTPNAVQSFPYVAVLWMSGLEAAFHLSTRYCAPANTSRSSSKCCRSSTSIACAALR